MNSRQRVCDTLEHRKVDRPPRHLWTLPYLSLIHIYTDSLDAEGMIRFGRMSPIRYDIMGPFRYIPFMECRHSVFSMQHTVNGRLRINGVDYIFQDGTGYIEGDRGYSFPKHYAWTQYGFNGGSLMLSVAEIPLGPASFTDVYKRQVFSSILGRFCVS